MARSPGRIKDMSETESPPPPETEATEQDDKGKAGTALDGLSGDGLRDLVEEALDRMELEELIVIIEAAQSRRRLKETEAKEILLAEFRERAAKMGMSLETLFPRYPEQTTRRHRSDAGQPLVPKFRGPNGETWSGRGIPPRWMSALEAQGRKREEFRIKEEEQGSLLPGDPG